MARERIDTLVWDAERGLPVLQDSVSRAFGRIWQVILLTFAGFWAVAAKVCDLFREVLFGKPPSEPLQNVGFY